MGRHDGSTQSLPAADEPAAKTVSFIHKLAASDAFKSLFKEGMALVEEAAAYLDGPGRQESRQSAPPRRPGLCDGEHAAHDAAHAGRLLAAAPARGQRGRIDDGAGVVREAQGPARRAGHRLRRRTLRTAPAGAAPIQPEIPAPAGARRASRPVDGGRQRARPDAAALARWPLRSSGCGRPSRAEPRDLRLSAPSRDDESASPRGCAAALLAALVGNLRSNGNLTARHGRRFLLPPLSHHAAFERRRPRRVRAALRRSARRRATWRARSCASPRPRKATPNESSSASSNWRRRATSRRSSKTTRGWPRASARTARMSRGSERN